MTDAQEYKDILSQTSDNGVDTLKDALSTYQKELEISKAIIARGEQLAPNILDDQSNLLQNNIKTYQADADPIYSHGEALNSGLSFPLNPHQGDFFLRTDYTPAVLFAYRGTRWQRITTQNGPVDLQEHVLNGADFINNNAMTVVGNQEFPERQALSQIVKPKTDF
jgi:hypothetical protein